MNLDVYLSVFTLCASLSVLAMWAASAAALAGIAAAAGKGALLRDQEECFGVAGAAGVVFVTAIGIEK